jgi:excisionase family DNA binding protein
MEKLHQGQVKVSYSVPEVAEIFGITNYRVRMMIKLGQIKAILAGKQLLIMNTELDRVLNRNHG